MCLGDLKKGVEKNDQMNLVCLNFFNYLLLVVDHLGLPTEVSRRI